MQEEARRHVLACVLESLVGGDDKVQPQRKLAAVKVECVHTWVSAEVVPGHLNTFLDLSAFNRVMIFLFMSRTE